MKNHRRQAVHGDVPAPPVQVLMDFRAAGHRKQHQAGQAGTAPEIAIARRPASSGLSPRRNTSGCSPRAITPSPTDESEGSAVDRLSCPPERHEATVVPISASSSKASRGAPPGELLKRVLGGDDHHQGDQHDAHHPAGQPLAQIGMVPAHRGRMLDLLETPAAGLLGQPQHHTQEGINQHHREEGMGAARRHQRWSSKLSNGLKTVGLRGSAWIGAAEKPGEVPCLARPGCGCCQGSARDKGQEMYRQEGSTGLPPDGGTPKASAELGRRGPLSLPPSAASRCSASR